MQLDSIATATPQTAKFGKETRVIARVPVGTGERGMVVRLGSEYVKLFSKIRSMDIRWTVEPSKGSELWSVATLAESERAALPAPAPAPVPPPAPVPVPVPAPPSKRPRVLPSYDVSPAPSPAPVLGDVKPSPMAAHVADLIGGFAAEADERSDNEADNSDTERKAATIAARILRRFAADIRAGRVAL